MVEVLSANATGACDGVPAPISLAICAGKNDHTVKPHKATASSTRPSKTPLDNAVAIGNATIASTTNASPSNISDARTTRPGPKRSFRTPPVMTPAAADSPHNDTDAVISNGPKPNTAFKYSARYG